MMEWKD
jgi:hypothetical protein